MTERRFTRLFVAAIGCAVLGGGALVWGYLVAPEAFFTAWLAAFFYWLSMPLGALALLLVHDLTGGKWEAIARLPLEASTATMPLFILAFLPIVAGMHELYSWTRPETIAELRNRWYLNPSFFGIRAGIYFIVWNGFAFVLLRRPHREGVSPPPAQWASGVGLVLMGLTVTFAAVDWLMSIEPDWFSTAYGLMVGAGQFVVSLSLVLVVVALAVPAHGGDKAFSDRLANLATILLAVDIFWAYTAYSQWLIIWEENLSFEIGWYIERLSRGWKSLLYVIVAVHFVIPFLALVWTPTKRSRAIVGVVAAMLLAAGLLQVWWLVLPAFPTSGFSWLNPVAAIALGGVWSCFFLWHLRHRHILFERAAEPIGSTARG
jgi:hypothetical protein